MRIFSVVLLFAATAPAQEGAEDAAYRPEVAEASEEGREAMAKFRVPEGFELELAAAEPALANPVCFYPARDGSIYVCETFRLHAGVTDMREHTEHLEEDMACRTVEDRVAMFARWAEGELTEQYGTEHERVRLLRDTDGDGVFESAQVFADGFHDPADGIAAGVLEHEGDVFYTCIPHLWRLRDTDGDGQADERTALSSGYGVRVTLLGHDLHGLAVGPDGWLYFSCGDRGFHVETEEGTIEHPDTGAVLRCRLDGSGLEVFHTGLRNPQELAFDRWGNLFTGDNNSDGGDLARWVQIVEGADSGWRSSYQWIFEPVARGPWNAEQLWKPEFEGQAAYLLPPIENIASGPSGLCYDPGTGLPDELAGSFFLADFRGTAGSSGIHRFRLEAEGAGFRLVEREEFLWGSLVTDVDFAPDGSLLFSDWVHGWGMTGKGRLYRLVQPDERAAPQAAQVAKILSNGVSERALEELQVLLRHPDQRVRQLAQFELVQRGQPGWERLQETLKAAEHELASLHAVWGLGMAAEGDEPQLEYLHPFLRDSNPRIRAQVARVLGDHRYAPAAVRLIEALADEDAQVRLFAAIGCARLADARAVEALVQLARDSAATDPVLRHAAAYALASCASAAELLELGSDEDESLRLVAVVALRRQGNSAVGEFLEDASSRVVLEAARAIHDLPIEGAMEALAAKLTDGALTDEGLLVRALSASQRVGGEAQAAALGAFARDAGRPDRLRTEAVRMLASWSEPPPRDFVLGHWRPLDARPAEPAEWEARRLGEVLAGHPDTWVRAWCELARRHPFEEATALGAAVIRDREREGSTRVAALSLVEALEPEAFEELVRYALGDADGELRAAALATLPRVDFAGALPLFETVLESGGLEERRAVYAALGRTEDLAAQNLLLAELGKLEARALPAELELDLMEAMAEQGGARVSEAVLRIREEQESLDPTLGKWRATYFGGDAERGREIYEQDPALSCVRCHLSGDEAEFSVGPDLSGLGRRLSRDQIVEAVVAPNARIAPGYETVLLVLEEDELLAGRIVEEGEEWLVLMNSDGELIDVEVASVLERRPDLSAMPEGLGELLTPRQMRDLVEYLSGR